MKYLYACVHIYIMHVYMYMHVFVCTYMFICRYKPYEHPLSVCDIPPVPTAADGTLSTQILPLYISCIVVITLKLHISISSYPFLPLLSGSGNDSSEVPSFTVLHNDIKCTLHSLYDSVMVTHNTRMSELSKQVHLLD